MIEGPFLFHLQTYTRTPRHLSEFFALLEFGFSPIRRLPANRSHSLPSPLAVIQRLALARRQHSPVRYGYFFDKVRRPNGLIGKQTSYGGSRAVGLAIPMCLIASG